jgi:uncharacterized protein (TIGR01777 family)
MNIKDQNILIAGGSGFLGKALTAHFEKGNNTVWTLSRNPRTKWQIKWDGKTMGDWCDKIEEADVVINLCGKSVDCRYTEANKKEILNSRIIPTRLLDLAIAKAENKPKVFINASSSTVYVHSENTPMSEAEGIIGDDFSENIVKSWETAFFENEIKGVRKVALRISFVLGKDGGAIPKLSTFAKLGLGGKQGKGNQFISWIHVEDFCLAVDRIIQRDTLKGAINLASPNPVSNKNFMACIRDMVKAPFHINQPTWLLEVATFFLRTETELVLKSRYVHPKILLDDGFTFKYPELSGIDNLV